METFKMKSKEFNKFSEHNNGNANQDPTIHKVESLNYFMCGKLQKNKKDPRATSYHAQEGYWKHDQEKNFKRN